MFNILERCLLQFLIYSSAIKPLSTAKLPNIIFILADDLGYNDVSFHGSTQPKTPNIDKLARSGTVLTRHYTQPVCSPSRGALLTSKYAIHIGLQNGIIEPSSPTGLPLSEKLMPEYFRDLGYETHAIGKWHLGFYQTDYLPTERGFDSFFGFYGGNLDYYDHIGTHEGYVGLDFHNDTSGQRKNMWGYFGTYSTDLYTQRAEEVVKNRQTSKPLFIYFAHQGVHRPLQGHDEYFTQFDGVWDQDRRIYLSQVSSIDESVGRLIEVLTAESILDETIIVFTSDNGGQVGTESQASNYPLRGGKNYNFEGGVRTPAFLTGPGIPKESTYDHLFHLVDWMPTLLAAVNSFTSRSQLNTRRDIDGIDHWNSILVNSQSAQTEDKTIDYSSAPRRELLVNIHQQHGESAIIRDNFKLHKVTRGLWLHEQGGGGEIMDGWYHYRGPFNQTDTRRIDTVDNWKLPITNCNIPVNYTECNLKPNSGTLACLFDIMKDPCEYNNIALEHPEIVEKLSERLKELKLTMVESAKRDSDPRADPSKHGNVWDPWVV